MILLQGRHGQLPRGLKRYSTQFSRLPYYEHLQVAHLFDTMHIGKNVTECLWKLIDGRNNKEKNAKVISDIQDSNSLQHLTHSYGNGNSTNLPWLLTEQESSVVKEIVRTIKFPTGFASNISNILTKQGDFGGAKTHDWHTFIKVQSYCNLNYLMIYTLFVSNSGLPL